MVLWDSDGTLCCSMILWQIRWCRTSLFYDREALWNLSRRLSTPISHPRDLNLTQIYEERMGHIHTATWKKIRGMLALVDEELKHSWPRATLFKIHDSSLCIYLGLSHLLA